ncbi:integrase zinc binding domain-containing protein, partial [Actinobacillus pleuropneumoniae]
KRALRLKSKQYDITNDVLFRKNYDSILLRFLEKFEEEKVLQELHDGPIGGHFGGDTTMHKILHAGYYWPTLFKDTHKYV